MVENIFYKLISTFYIFTLNFCIIKPHKISDIRINEVNPPSEIIHLNMELKNAGFHRDLYYEIHMEKALDIINCKFIIKQDLPAAVYINVDQMNDLVRLNRLNAIYPPHVDVELPTKDSSGFTVFLLLMSELQQNISLPIHFRYHSPGNTTYVNVQLDNPTMYMNCENYKSLSNDDGQEGYCLDGLQFTRKMHDVKKDCNWMQINYNIHLKSPLNADIPIGYQSLYKYVAYVTIISGWLGCVYLLFLTSRKIALIHSKIKGDHVD